MCRSRGRGQPSDPPSSLKDHPAMSLDVYLDADFPTLAPDGGSGIFIRSNGQTVEITRDELDRAFPGQELVVVTAEADINTRVYSANITHNLGKMADAAGIYKALWRPEEIGIVKAAELIEPLSEGLAKLKSDPGCFEKFNSPNGWGLYKHFVPFVEQYLEACTAHPDATVSVSR